MIVKHHFFEVAGIVLPRHFLTPLLDAMAPRKQLTRKFRKIRRRFYPFKRRYVRSKKRYSRFSKKRSYHHSSNEVFRRFVYKHHITYTSRTGLVKDYTYKPSSEFPLFSNFCQMYFQVKILQCIVKFLPTSNVRNYKAFAMLNKTQDTVDESLLFASSPVYVHPAPFWESGDPSLNEVIQDPRMRCVPDYIPFTISFVPTATLTYAGNTAPKKREYLNKWNSTESWSSVSMSGFNIAIENTLSAGTDQSTNSSHNVQRGFTVIVYLYCKFKDLDVDNLVKNSKLGDLYRKLHSFPGPEPSADPEAESMNSDTMNEDVDWMLLPPSCSKTL